MVISTEDHVFERIQEDSGSNFCAAPTGISVCVAYDFDEVLLATGDAGEGAGGRSKGAVPYELVAMISQVWCWIYLDLRRATFQSRSNPNPTVILALVMSP